MVEVELQTKRSTGEIRYLVYPYIEIQITLEAFNNLFI